jgi:hypothetical protein
MGTSDTYTYSMKGPRSVRERYMRAAPTDLCSQSQNHLSPGSGEAERTNRMATTVRVEYVSKFPSECVSTINLKLLLVDRTSN